MVCRTSWKKKRKKEKNNWGGLHKILPDIIWGHKKEEMSWQKFGQPSQYIYWILPQWWQFRFSLTNVFIENFSAFEETLWQQHHGNCCHSFDIHLFIFYHLSCSRSLPEAYPSWCRVKRGVHPGVDSSQSQGWHRDRQPFMWTLIQNHKLTWWACFWSVGGCMHY